MTGLTGLEVMDGRRMDWCLILAFVERWHPETNSFHFVWGEMTVTLHDVVQIMQMRIDGRAYRSSYEWLSDMYQTIAPIPGMDPTVGFNVEKSDGYAIKAQLLERMRALQREELRNEQYIASVYLAMLLADTLFVGKSGMKCRPWTLGSVAHPDAASDYAWGAACLAFLYRELGNAFRVGAASIAGSSLLLRVWI